MDSIVFRLRRIIGGRVPIPISNARTQSVCKVYGREMAMEAIAMGNLKFLKRLCKNGAVLDADACAVAAARGRLDCLRFLHESGCPWDSNTPAMAAAGNHLDCLRYAYKCGCPWDEFTILHAIEHGSERCELYAIANGCPEPPAGSLMLEIFRPSA